MRDPDINYTKATLRELTPAQQASARTRAEVLRQSIKRTSYLD